MKPWMLAAISGGPQLVTETFYSNTTWTAPATTSVNLSGKGTNGTSFTTLGTSQPIFSINYRTDTNTGSGSVTWSNFTPTLNSKVSDLNADGVASWTFTEVDVWPDGKNTVTGQTPISVSDAIPGSVSASSNMPASGPITQSGSANINYDYRGPGEAGVAATGFGRTFPGGAVGQTAPTTTFNDIAVTPGQQFVLNIPVGASISITYYK